MKILYNCKVILVILFFLTTWQARAQQQKLTGYFIENLGQVKTDKGTSADNVIFYAPGRMGIFVTTNGFSMVVETNAPKGEQLNRIDVKFLNTTISKQQVIYISDKTPSPQFNIYTPALKLEGIKTTHAVIIKNLYPGIDWVWMIDKNGAISHDFMVNIGADASVIKYSIEGAEVANGAGNILTYSNQGFKVSDGPVVYQTRNGNIPAKILMTGSTVSFSITDSLKKAGGFTIDPPIALVWDNGFDTIKSGYRSIKSDAAGNTFTAGYSSDFTLPVFPQVTGSYQSSNPTNRDVVLMKTDVGQNLLWATFLGGSGNDEANAVTVTPTSIFVTGYSESWDFPLATAGNYNHYVDFSTRDAFILKFDTKGIWKWSTGFGGNGVDEGMDVQYYDGNIFLAGYTSSAAFPVRQNGGAYFNGSNTGGIDGFITQFDTACNLTWSTYFGGSGNDYFTSLTADGNGLYITGYTDTAGSVGFPLMQNGGAYYQNTGYGNESFVLNFNAGLGLQWSTYFGGSGNDYASNILLNQCGLFICGKTTSTDLPTQSQGNGDFAQLNYGGGGSDGFIVKFDLGTLQKTYCTYYGDSGYDALTKMGTDAACNTIFTGFGQGALASQHPSDYFYTNPTNNGGFDAIMLGLNSTQALFWSTFFGQRGNDFGYAVNFASPYMVDMVGEGLYNFGQRRIGGTYTMLPPSNYPLVTSNGESNRFYNLDSTAGNGSGGSGGGGGGGGQCPLLQFQALIPVQNSCPQQCNGVAYIDTANIGGCQPYTYLWSSGDQATLDSQLCETYWNMVTDAANQHRTIYSRFDVLRNDPVQDIYVDCGVVPDWNGLLHIHGGGPPYNIVDRGSTGYYCPYTEYFYISDTANCSLNVYAPWFVMNWDLAFNLSLNSACKLVGEAVEQNPGNCIDLSRTAGWQYVLVQNNDTTYYPFNHSTAPQVLTTALPGATYTGYISRGGCSASFPSIYNYGPMQYNISQTSACSADSNTGSITITYNSDSTALAAVGSYVVNYKLYEPGNVIRTGSINISSAGTVQRTISNLGQGDFELDIWIPNSCDSDVIHITLSPISVSLNDPNLMCSRTGFLVANVTGGTPPYTYYWNGTAGADSLYVSTGGDYYLLVKDSVHCKAADTVFLYSSLGINIWANENESPCDNTTNSTVSLIVSGGNPPYTYTWSAGNPINEYNQIPPGVTSVTVSDAFNCSATQQITNTKQLPPTDSLIVDSISCYNSNDGSIQVIVNNGYPVYNITWGNNQTGSSISNLGPGGYSCVIVDSKGCVVVDNAILIEPQPINIATSALPAICTQANGSATVNATGGTGTLIYNWDNESNGATNYGLNAGSIGFTVTDANNCRVSGIVVVPDSDDLSVQNYESDVTCLGGGHDGSASVTVFGAAPPVNYSWSTGSTAPFIFNLGPGNYTVLVTDGNGCSFTDVIIVNAQPIPSVSIDTGQGILCYGSTANVYVSAAGGTPPYTGEGQQQFGAGANTASIIDNNGCSAAISFSLTNPPLLVADTQNLVQPNCYSQYGSVTINASGGIPPYQAMVNSQPVLNFSQSGSIQFLDSTVTEIDVYDANQCMVALPVQIVNYYPILYIDGPLNPSCYGGNNGEDTLHIIGGISPFTINIWPYNYSTNFDSTDILFDSLSVANPSTITIYDARGCYLNYIPQLSQNDSISISYEQVQPVSCASDTSWWSFDVTGGTNSYNRSLFNVPYLPGADSFAVMDGNGCVNVVWFNVDTLPIFNADTTIGQPSCGTALGTFRVVPDTGAPYTLLTNSYPYNFNDSLSIYLPEGTYSFTLQNRYQCVITYNFTIGPPDSLLGMIETLNPTCNGYNNGRVTIIMQSGASPYKINGQWFSDTIVYPLLTAGNYVYTVTDLNGCQQVFGTSLNDPSAIIIDTPYLVNAPTCYNTTDGAVSFNIRGGGAPYTYGLVITPGDTLNNGTNSFGGLWPGNYTAVVTDTNRCSVGIAVNMPAFIPSNDSLVIDSTLCFGAANGEIKIYPQPNSRGPYNYSINGGAVQVFNVFNNLEAGSYQLVVSDINNCRDTFNVNIAQPDSIDGRVWINDTLLPVDSIILTSRGYANFMRHSGGPWSVTFSPPTNYIVYNDTLVTVQPSEDLTYTVRVYMNSTNKDCYIQYTGYLEVLDIPELPNTFTPNGDGINDTWKIDLIKYPHSALTIFDRWGEIVYTSTDYNNDWGGIDQKNGKPLPDGTYFYVLKLPSLNNSILKGDINIVDARH